MVKPPSYYCSEAAVIVEEVAVKSWYPGRPIVTATALPATPTAPKVSLVVPRYAAPPPGAKFPPGLNIAIHALAVVGTVDCKPNAT